MASAYIISRTSVRKTSASVADGLTSGMDGTHELIVGDTEIAHRIRETAKGSFTEALIMLVSEHTKWCFYCKGHIDQKNCINWREDYAEIRKIFQGS